MFIGHFAVGFASKRAAPRTSLGWLLAAVCFPDILWPIFLIAGVETVRIDPGNTAFTPLDFVSYPISHSLLAVCVWALLVGGIYRAATGYTPGGWMMALGVLSHWILDAVSHRPDMPLLPEGGPKVGLGLWNSVPATVVVESLMFLAGLIVYGIATRAKDAIGRWGFLAFAALLASMYVADIFSPPPPSVTAIAWVSLVMGLLFGWAAWFDRHRRAVTGGVA
jgi:hypothetical protein